jgi:hypothetical protein
VANQLLSDYVKLHAKKLLYRPNYLYYFTIPANDVQLQPYMYSDSSQVSVTGEAPNLGPRV